MFLKQRTEAMVGLGFIAAGAGVYALLERLRGQHDGAASTHP